MSSRDFKENSITRALEHAGFGVRQSLVAGTPPVRACRPRAGEPMWCEHAFGPKPAA